MIQKTLDSGPEALAEIFSGLQAPGQGDDAVLRRFIHGLALEAGASKSPRKEAFTKAVVGALLGNLPEPCKGFLVEQMFLVGSVRSSTESLLRALPKAQGSQRFDLLLSLGKSGGDKALAALASAASDPDELIRLAAYAALVDLKDPRGSDVLLKGYERETGLARHQTLRRIFELAEARSAQGFRAEAASLYRGLYTKIKTDGNPSAVAACLMGLAANLEPGSFEELRTALASEDPDLRAVAVAAAASSPGSRADAYWVGALKEKKARVGVLAVLRLRGAKSALPAVKELLRNGDAEIREAALETAASLGGADSVADLLTHWESGPPGDRSKVSDLLIRVPGDGATEELASAAQFAGGEVPELRAFLIRVLAARNASKFIDLVWGATADPDAGVRIAALEAVGVLGEGAIAPRLAAFLLEEKDEAALEAGSRALALCAGREADPEKKALPVLEIWPKSQGALRLALIRALGRLGGTQALETLEPILESKADPERDAVLRALGDWPDGTPLPNLVTLAGGSGTLTTRVLALRGAVRLALLPSSRNLWETSVLMEKLYKSATRTEDKKTVLGALGGIPHGKALSLALAAMKEAPLADEAAAAALKIAKSLAGEDPKLSEGAYAKIIKNSRDPGLKAGAEKALDALYRNVGMILSWSASGPYGEEGAEAAALFDAALAPESGGGDWRTASGQDEGKDFGLLDFLSLFGGENKAAYARVVAVAPRKMGAVLEMGSDDGIKVWLNGVQVHANKVARGHDFGDDKVSVKLKKGDNSLLFKVVNGNGGWALSCRVRDASGRPIPGLRFRAE